LRNTLDKRTSPRGQALPVAGTSGHGATGDDADANADGDEAFERPSRSARKRQAEALQKLGVGLTRMRPAKLRELQLHLHLPEALFEALLEVHRLRSGPALARQRQYIGRLMRDVDPLPIERALAEFSRSGDAKLK
jgi:ribosome-associated protein